MFPNDYNPYQHSIDASRTVPSLRSRELSFSQSIGVLGHCSQYANNDMSCVSSLQHSSLNVTNLLESGDKHPGFSIIYKQAWTFMIVTYILSFVSTLLSFLMYLCKIKFGWNRSCQYIVLIVSLCRPPFFSFLT